MDHSEIAREPRQAAANRLPKLVELADLRGDLHAHTKASDGRETLLDMAFAARGRGLSYLAITDHSSRLAVANWLHARRLIEQIEEIDRLNRTLDELRTRLGSGKSVTKAAS